MIPVVHFLPPCPECGRPSVVQMPGKLDWYYECRAWTQHASGRPLHFRTRDGLPPLVRIA